VDVRKIKVAFWFLILGVFLLNPKIVRAEKLKIFDQNIYGFPQHLDQRLTKIIEKAKGENSDLILLQEIILKKTLDNLDLSGYYPVYSNNRKFIIDGDLVILVKNSLKENVESKYIKFKNQGRGGLGFLLVDRWLDKGYLRLCWKDRNFCVINTHTTANYFPWLGFKTQEEQLRQIIEENKDKEVVIIGDYNLRSLDNFKDMIDLDENLPSSMVGHDFKIDHVLTNIEELRRAVYVSYVSYSDWVSDHRGMVIDLIY
jgi:exonuclease III